MCGARHPALKLVPEAPVAFGGRVYVARRVLERSPWTPRWEVHIYHGAGLGELVGYLDAFWDPRESDDWQLLVWDKFDCPIGYDDSHRKDNQTVSSYQNALSHISTVTDQFEKAWAGVK